MATLIINGTVVSSISGLTAVSFSALLSALTHTTPRLHGNRIIESTCQALLTEEIAVNDFIGQCTLYQKGYVVFNYVNHHTGRQTYTVSDLFGKYTYYSVDITLNQKVDLSSFGALNAFEVILMDLSNRIEHNMTERDKSKTVSSDFDYTYPKHDGVRRQMTKNTFTPDYITTVIQKADDAKQSQLRNDMKNFINDCPLTDGQRQVINLRKQGYTFKEIADMLSSSISNVSGLYYRGKKKHPNDVE